MRKFREKPRKGTFTQLNGDLVKVPVIHHDRYLMTLAYAIQLKAQVMNCRHTLMYHTSEDINI